MLPQVLSLYECKQLIACANKIGYVPSLSYSISGNESRDGAEGCVWIVPPNIQNTIFDRVEPFLPAYINNRPLTGINSRFRFYRYSLDALYRPHVDGSWPASEIKDGKYTFDAGNGEWSCLTLLIYLNEGFEGGSTTFFWPSSDGALNCKGIVPKTGAVVVFPHGDTSGALVHEGSQVLCGYKYVIRTDVLYKKQIKDFK